MGECSKQTCRAADVVVVQQFRSVDCVREAVADSRQQKKSARPQGCVRRGSRAALIARRRFLPRGYKPSGGRKKTRDRLLCMCLIMTCVHTMHMVTQWY